MKNLILCMLSVVLMTSCSDQPRRSTDNGLLTIPALGQALNTGKHDFVIKQGKRYLEEYPDSDQVWNLLGWAYAKTENLEKAQECFETALSINTTNDNAYVGLGAIHRKAGNNDKARESYQEAIRITPKNPEALGSLLVVELVEGRYEEAIACGEKAWSYNKALGSIPANLCIAYHYQNNPTKRDYYYGKAQELKYPLMAGLDDIIAGRTSIGHPPKEDAE